MGQDHKFAFVDIALAKRARQQQVRSLHPLQPQDPIYVLQQEQRLLNFSSNDYLGLSKHPALIAAAQRYTQLYGTGATASRLIAGTYDIHLQLETNFAAACGREAALLFSSGFQANSTILPALLDRQSLVLCDRLVHNSLIQGILASGAQFVRYSHNDLNHLEAALKKTLQKSYSRILIVTETVFSMDGDRSDVVALIQLADRFNAILYLDDAHAMGVMGKDGMGLAAHRDGIDLVVGTFGKAFGSFGAVVTCSTKVRDYLINHCPGFIYTTALPPAVIGAIEMALSLMPALNAERANLMQQAILLRTNLHAIGINTGASDSQIIPMTIGAETQTLYLANWLKQQGILATAVRPPTVPPATSRIRLTVSSCHTVEHLQLLINAITSWHPS
jgi:8-amino-7-oxononanoate synthase